jgi:hypothetical protein
MEEVIASAVGRSSFGLHTGTADDRIADRRPSDCKTTYRIWARRRTCGNKKHTNTYIHIASICRRWGGGTRSESKAGEIDIKNESRRKSARKTLHSWDPQEERRKPVSKSKSGNKKSTRSHQKKGKTTLDRKRAGGENRVSTEAPIMSKGGTGRGGTRGKQKR